MAQEKKLQVRVVVGGRRVYIGSASTLQEKKEIMSEALERYERQVREGHIVADDGVIIKPRFKHNDTVYEVIGSEIGSDKKDGIFGTLDSVKNTTTKTIKVMTRKSLYDLTRKNKNG